VVVVGIEPGWTQRVVDGIAKTGKPVEGFAIEKHGDINTISRASWAAKKFVQDASMKQREECGIDELWISTKCGESDTTSGWPRTRPSATSWTSSYRKARRCASARPPS